MMQIERGARVAWIEIAPVKGMALTGLERAMLGPGGVDGDRRYAVLDAANRLVNGKRIGRLATIAATTASNPASLALAVPDGRGVEADVRLGEPVDASFFGRARPTHRVLGPFDAWLSEWADEELRLVRLDESGSGVDRALLGGSVTLLSVAALDALGSAAGLDRPIDHRRFRMTMGIAGSGERVEDGWIGRRVRVGGALLTVRGNVGRCAVTTHDPATGRADLDTLRLIGQTHGDLDTTEPLPFGVWASVEVPGPVELGDPIALD